MLKLDAVEDLKALIDQNVAESLTLEFKSSPALSKKSDGRTELVKDVTALANSAGGQIVYGIKESAGVAREIDEGVSPSDFSAEWIEQVLDTNTSPRLQGVRIKAISVSSERVAYVLTVPQALTFAPHQNGLDKKYYKRFECRSVPMEDYEIRDCLRRNATPELQVRFYFEGRSNKARIDERGKFNLYFEFENIGNEPSLYSLFDFLIDIDLVVEKHRAVDFIGKVNFGDRPFNKWQKRLMVPETFPMVRGSTMSMNPPYFECSIPPNLNIDGNIFYICANSLAVGHQSIIYGAITVGVESVSIEFPLPPANL